MASFDEICENWQPHGHEEMQIKGDQGICSIGRLIFTVGIFCGHEMWEYSHRFCYHTKAEALLAFNEWSGKEGTEPEGYIVRK